MDDLGRTADDDDVAAIERWFVARGLPHFVEPRPTAWESWGREIPLLVGAYLLLGLNALDLERWSWAGNLAAALFVVAVLALTWVGANVLRRRPPLQRPTSIGPFELALLVLVPAVPSALLGQWGDVVQTVLQGAAVLAVLWALRSYGGVALIAWAWRKTGVQLPAFLNVVLRGLPLLLLFTTFLFVNAEVWEVAGTLQGPTYLVVLGIFFVLGNVFLFTRLPAVMRKVATFDSWADLADNVRAVGIVSERRIEALESSAGPPEARPALLRQRLNLGVVAVFSQALQITATAASMFGFFVLFGWLAIGADTAAGWTGAEGRHVLSTVTFGGRQLVISEPLLRVAGFLAAFAGMYFTVVLSTDATYREELSEDIGPELRQALAVRMLYRRLLDATMTQG